MTLKWFSSVLHALLLSPHSKKKLLEKYPAAANQYNIYCRDNNRKMTANFKNKRDETFHLGKLIKATND